MHATLQAEAPDDFCVATGVSHSLMEFVRFAFEAAGVADFEDRVRTNPDFVRPTDIPETRGDLEKARRTLGWQPSRPLEAVVAAMVEADQRRMASGTEHDLEYL